MSDALRCVFRGHQLVDFVNAALASSGGSPSSAWYNEVILLKRDYEALLPHAVEAVVCFGRTWDCAAARRVRESFLTAYKMTSSTERAHVPLLRYEATGVFVDVG